MMSLVHWGFSMVFSALLVRAMARRTDLGLDYRAAGAAACTGLGSVWALGLSSSAAQLQANAGSMPPALLAETGVIPFSQTIFFWQSMLCAAWFSSWSSTWIAWKHRAGCEPGLDAAQALGIDLRDRRESSRRTRPASGWSISPIPSCSSRVGLAFLAHEFAGQRARSPRSRISTPTIFCSSSLRWCCSGGRDALSMPWRGACPERAGVLIQFPFLGAIAAILTGAKNGAGETLSGLLGSAFTHIASHATLRADHRRLLGAARPVRSLGRRQVDRSRRPT